MPRQQTRCPSVEPDNRDDHQCDQQCQRRVMAVFIVGRMIGRMPEYLGKEIEPDASRPRHLMTESGVGYRFVP